MMETLLKEMYPNTVRTKTIINTVYNDSTAINELYKQLSEILDKMYNREETKKFRTTLEEKKKPYFNGPDNDAEPMFSLDAYLSCIAREAYRIARDSQYPNNSKARDRKKGAKGNLGGLIGLGPVFDVDPEDIDDAIKKGKNRLKF